MRVGGGREGRRLAGGTWWGAVDWRGASRPRCTSPLGKSSVPYQRCYQWKSSVVHQRSSCAGRRRASRPHCTSPAPAVPSSRGERRSGTERPSRTPPLCSLNASQAPAAPSSQQTGNCLPVTSPSVPPLHPEIVSLSLSSCIRSNLLLRAASRWPRRCPSGPSRSVLSFSLPPFPLFPPSSLFLAPLSAGSFRRHRLLHPMFLSR